EDPAAHVQMRRQQGGLPHALGKGDVARLVTATVPGGRRPQRDRALLELLYACGLRVSEAVGLKVHEANLEAGYVTVIGKGGKERVVPLGPHARDAILEYLAGERPRLLRGKASAWLFVRAGGRPLSRQTVWKLVRTRARAAAVETHVSPHTLRHTFATHLLRGGAAPRAVQAPPRHPPTWATPTYTPAPPPLPPARH